MARVLYPDTAYSFRRLHAVIVGDAAAADTQVLARIEQLLVAAGEAFRARRYLDAQPDRERRRPRVERGGHLACASTPKWLFETSPQASCGRRGIAKVDASLGVGPWSPPGPRGRRAILRREAPHPETPTPRPHISDKVGE